MMRAKDLYNAGVDAYEACKFEDAASFFQRGFTAYAAQPATIDSRIGQADCLSNLAVCYAEVGNLYEAQETYTSAISHYDKLLPQAPAVQEDLARCHMNLGNTLNELGCHNDALNAFSAGLKHYLPIDDSLRQQGMCLVGIANALQRLGRQAEARELYSRALSMYDHLNNVDVYRADATMNLANTLGDLGHEGIAIVLYRQAAAVYRTDPAWSHEHACCLMNMAATFRRLGDNGKAIRLYFQARDLLRTLTRDPHALGVCLMNAAVALLSEGNINAANEAMIEALNIFASRPGSEREYVLCLINRAALLRDLGLFLDAKAVIADARHFLADVTDPEVAYDLAYHEANLELLQRSAHPTTAAGHSQRGLKLALEAAIHSDEKRFSLSNSSDRMIWIRNVASQHMNLALDYCTHTNNPLLLAELVAKWRMSGTLGSRSDEKNDPDAAIPTVIVIPSHGGDLSTSWERIPLSPSTTSSDSIGISRYPGPLLQLPYQNRSTLGLYMKGPESRARARYA